MEIKFFLLPACVADALTTHAWPLAVRSRRSGCQGTQAGSHLRSRCWTTTTFLLKTPGIWTSGGLAMCCAFACRRTGAPGFVQRTCPAKRYGGVPVCVCVCVCVRACVCVLETAGNVSSLQQLTHGLCVCVCVWLISSLAGASPVFKQREWRYKYCHHATLCRERALPLLPLLCCSRPHLLASRLQQHVQPFVTLIALSTSAGLCACECMC